MNPSGPASPPSPVRVLCVCGARPNFMKIAPLMRELGTRDGVLAKLVHTGQHYDEKLSKVFFEDLEIRPPDAFLEVGSGSHAEQTAAIMSRFEPVLQRERPHVVVVVGDVNSTLAAAVVASKFHHAEPFLWASPDGDQPRTRPVIAHVEAGLRSGDMDMPEEVNRKVTDAISDLLLVSDPAGLAHLRREGAPKDRVHYVGNVMIDTLKRAEQRARSASVLEDHGLEDKAYGLVTLHRPSNVDDKEQRRLLVRTIEGLDDSVRWVFPMHPRTRARMQAEGEELDPARWKVLEPLGYLDFLRLQMGARVVLTDSGGIQEETTVLGVPCLTLRENTERPVTIDEGTNVLATTAPARIREAFAEAMARPTAGRIPKLWDGRAAVRIADLLLAGFRSGGLGRQEQAALD